MFIGTFGDRAILAVKTETGWEPWISDGTPAGTTMLADINPGQADGLARNELFVARGRLYFAADDGIHGAESWRTDDTPDGTQMAADLCTGHLGSVPRDFMSVGNRLFFTAITHDRGRELLVIGAPPEPKNSDSGCAISGRRGQGAALLAFGIALLFRRIRGRGRLVL